MSKRASSMIPSRTRVEVGSILTPQDAQRLRQACPDLDDWPRSWHYEPADLEVGQRIVSALTPFLLHLLDQGLAKKTVSRHRDNLWLLGGELVKRRYDDKKLARKDINDALLQLIEGDGGPLMWPSITEAEQDSVDATCRRLYRYMRDCALAGSTAN